MPCYDPSPEERERENERLDKISLYSLIYEEEKRKKEKERSIIKKDYKKSLVALIDSVLRNPEATLEVYEKLFCIISDELNKHDLLTNELLNKYLSHRKEDVNYYKTLYKAELNSLISKETYTAEEESRIKMLAKKLTELNNCSDADLLNRNFEKI